MTRGSGLLGLHMEAHSQENSWYLQETASLGETSIWGNLGPGHQSIIKHREKINKISKICLHNIHTMFTK